MSTRYTTVQREGSIIRSDQGSLPSDSRVTFETLVLRSYTRAERVHIKSHFIMNGVCVRFRGWLDMERLDGIGCLELDEKRAAQEDAILREQLERYNQRLRDFEDKQRTYQRTTQDEFEQMRRNGSGIGVGVTAGASGMWRR
uniref:Uncharacterized protein n=1 Tax=Anopheles culicifacies TaxID=139723 RepID=A0A182MHG2_9DIPT